MNKELQSVGNELMFKVKEKKKKIIKFIIIFIIIILNRQKN